MNFPYSIPSFSNNCLINSINSSLMFENPMKNKVFVFGFKTTSPSPENNPLRNEIVNSSFSRIIGLVFRRMNSSIHIKLLS